MVAAKINRWCSDKSIVWRMIIRAHGRWCGCARQIGGEAVLWNMATIISRLIANLWNNVKAITIARKARGLSLENLLSHGEIIPKCWADQPVAWCGLEVIPNVIAKCWPKADQPSARCSPEVIPNFVARADQPAQCGLAAIGGNHPMMRLFPVAVTEVFECRESTITMVVKKPSWSNSASPGFASVSWSGLHKKFRQSRCPNTSGPARAKPLWAVYSSRSSKCRAFSQHPIRPKALFQKKSSPNFRWTILKTCWSRLYDFGRSKECVTL